jgi:ribonuclease P protein component
VAYSISRQVGGAVVRNRLRRRLRAIVSEQAAGLPPGAYVVGSGPGGPLLEFDELKVAMSRALEQATR